MRRWFEQWVCSSWCRLVFQYRGFFCRYHRWLRYQGWRRHQCAQEESGLKGQSCMAQRRQLRFVGMDKQWIRVWISYRNRLKVFREEGIQVLIQFLLRRRWRRGNLGDLCIDQRAFWLCLGRDRRFPYQWCSDLWRSCWRHLPFLRWVALGGKVICRFQF